MEEEKKDKAKIDELEIDIDSLLEETEEALEEQKKEEEKEKKESDKTEISEEKPKKKFKLPKIPINFIIWGVLGLIIIIFVILIFFEANKKFEIRSAYLIIDKDVVYITPEKILEQKIKSQYKKYKFHFKLAYKFPSVKGYKILSCIVDIKFHSKQDIPLENIYELATDLLFNKFDKITKNKYIEEIKNYKSFFSEIIKNTIISLLEQNISDIDIDEIKKSFNFSVFIFS